MAVACRTDAVTLQLPVDEVSRSFQPCFCKIVFQLCCETLALLAREVFFAVRGNRSCTLSSTSEMSHVVSATLDASCCCGVKQFSGHVKVAQKFESTVQLVIELSFLQLPVKEE